MARRAIGGLDRGVLRIEAGKADLEALDRQARADQRNRADQHHRPGELHLRAHPAHITHVLFMMQAVDHAARAQEQQRLEEGMGEQVEHRRAIGANAGGEEHVTQLRTGGIGDHPLDVVLRQADGGSVNCGDAADQRHHRRGNRGEFVQLRTAAHHHHARRHHGGGMDQRGHRGWAFHRVRQPHMQEELRALAHRADEQ